jgi:hypothetical protein
VGTRRIGWQVFQLATHCNSSLSEPWRLRTQVTTQSHQQILWQSRARHSRHFVHRRHFLRAERRVRLQLAIVLRRHRLTPSVTHVSSHENVIDGITTRLCGGYRVIKIDHIHIDSVAKPCFVKSIRQVIQVAASSPLQLQRANRPPQPHPS